MRPILDGVRRQAERWGRHQPVTAQQKVTLGGGEVPAEANLPVGPVVVCAEQQYPDALQRDPAS